MFTRLFERILKPLKHTDRVVIEGYYSGEWLSSSMTSHHTSVISPETTLVAVNNYVFGLAGRIGANGKWERSQRVTSGSRDAGVPELETQFDDARYVFASDGRIFYRTDLTRETDEEDFDRLLSVLNERFEEGFNELFKAYLPSKHTGQSIEYLIGSFKKRFCTQRG